MPRLLLSDRVRVCCMCSRTPSPRVSRRVTGIAVSTPPVDSPGFRSEQNASPPPAKTSCSQRPPGTQTPAGRCLRVPRRRAGRPLPDFHFHLPPRKVRTFFREASPPARARHAAEAGSGHGFPFPREPRSCVNKPPAHPRAPGGTASGLDSSGNPFAAARRAWAGAGRAGSRAPVPWRRR